MAYDDAGMAKYPSVAKLFADSLADEFGVVSTDDRKKLMERTGRSNATVSRWISGEARPDPDTWRAIADVTETDTEVVAGASRGDQVAPVAAVRWTQVNGSPGDPATVDDVRAIERELEGESELRITLENDLSQLRAEVAQLARDVRSIAGVLGVTLGVGEQQAPTDAAQPDARDL